jgi:hypothetical protein
MKFFVCVAKSPYKNRKALPDELVSSISLDLHKPFNWNMSQQSLGRKNESKLWNSIVVPERIRRFETKSHTPDQDFQLEQLSSLVRKEQDPRWS